MQHPSTRGEIWLADIAQDNGAETGCDGLVVIISSVAFNQAPIRIVVPLVDWSPEFEGRIDKFRINANERNCLGTEHVAEFLRVSSVPTDRLVERKGLLDAEEIEEIAAGIVIAIDYRLPNEAP